MYGWFLERLEGNGMGKPEEVQNNIARFEYEMSKPLDKPWHAGRKHKPTTSELQADREAFLALQMHQQ
jgi:hypothetical protein